MTVALDADDETAFGLFSLFVWALDATTGAPPWDSTWPPPENCDSLEPGGTKAWSSIVP